MTPKPGAGEVCETCGGGKAVTDYLGPPQCIRCYDIAAKAPSEGASGVRRWHVTSRHDIDDVNTRCDEVMVNAADHDRVTSALNERLAELRAEVAQARELLGDCAAHFKTLRDHGIYVWPNHPLDPEKRIAALLAKPQGDK